MHVLPACMLTHYAKHFRLEVSVEDGLPHDCCGLFFKTRKAEQCGQNSAIAVRLGLRVKHNVKPSTFTARYSL